MVTKELTEYVRNERAKGVADDALRQVLQSSGGWSLTDIEEALRPQPSVPVAPYVPPAPTDLTQWRKRRKNQIFTVLTLIIIAISALFLLEGAEFFEFFYMPLIVLGIAYGISWFISRNVSPSSHDGLSLFGQILFAIVLGVILSSGLCTAIFFGGGFLLGGF